MTSTGLRERKKQETRQGLRSAALRLTAERGLDRVTVEDIAQVADVSVRTFFNYFPSKEEAVIGAEPESMEQIKALISARPVDEEPFLSLHAVFGEMAKGLVDARDVHVMRRKVVAENPSLLPRQVAAFVEFERILVQAITERTTPDPSSDADSALVVAAAVAAMRVSVDLWIAADGATELSDLLDRAFNRLAVGLVSPIPRTTPPPKAEPKALPKAPSPRKTLRKDL